MSRGIVVWPLVGASAVWVVVGIATNGAFAAWTAASAYAGSAIWATLVMPSGKQEVRDD